jgi:hypothetical protein
MAGLCSVNPGRVSENAGFMSWRPLPDPSTLGASGALPPELPMTLDLANIPADCIEASPDCDHASEPANDPACEPSPEATTPLAPEPANSIPRSAASPLPQESPVLFRNAAVVYPRDHFIHALYGSFLDTANLPVSLLPATPWDTFLDAYTNPDLSHYFDGAELPSA